MNDVVCLLRLKVYCYYDINNTYAVAFNTRARRSEPYADDAQGELEVEIRVASGTSSLITHYLLTTFSCNLMCDARIGSSCGLSQMTPTPHFTPRRIILSPSSCRSRCISRWNWKEPNSRIYRWSWTTVGRRLMVTGSRSPGGTSSLKGTSGSDAFCQIVSWVDVLKYLSFSCVNPVDPYKVIFHPVPVDKRVHYPSHFKRFEVQMFAFADEDDHLSHWVNSFFIYLFIYFPLPLSSNFCHLSPGLCSLWCNCLWCQKSPRWSL